MLIFVDPENTVADVVAVVEVVVTQPWACLPWKRTSKAAWMSLRSSFRGWFLRNRLRVLVNVRLRLRLRVLLVLWYPPALLFSMQLYTTRVLNCYERGAATPWSLTHAFKDCARRTGNADVDVDGTF